MVQSLYPVAEEPGADEHLGRPSVSAGWGQWVVSCEGDEEAEAAFHIKTVLPAYVCVRLRWCRYGVARRIRDGQVRRGYSI